MTTPTPLTRWQRQILRGPHSALGRISNNIQLVGFLDPRGPHGFLWDQSRSEPNGDGRHHSNDGSEDESRALNRWRQQAVL